MRFFIGYFSFGIGLATLEFRYSVTNFFHQLPQKIVHVCSAGIFAFLRFFKLRPFCFLLPAEPGVFGIHTVAFGVPDNAGVSVVAGVPLVGVSAVDDILLLLGHFASAGPRCCLLSFLLLLASLHFFCMASFCLYKRMHGASLLIGLLTYRTTFVRLCSNNGPYRLLISILEMLLLYTIEYRLKPHTKLRNL
jgi:hypothetical protein